MKTFCGSRERAVFCRLSNKVYSLNPMIMHAGIVNIDYYVTFGELQGYLRDEDGKKYILDGMLGMGEDKTLLL